MQLVRIDDRRQAIPPARPRTRATVLLSYGQNRCVLVMIAASEIGRHVGVFHSQVLIKNVGGTYRWKATCRIIM